MGLNVDGMDLFGGKKANKPKIKPVVVKKPISVVEEAEEVREQKQEIIEPVISQNKRQVKVKSKAKFDKFTPVTARITEDLYMDLKTLENRIMRSRSKSTNLKRERITTNSVLRCLISSFLERTEDLDISEIQNEEILADRIEKLFS